MIKIDTKDLCIGMHVSGLDRPWLETPFLFQGFRIDNDEQLREVQRICRYVYVDEESADVPFDVAPQRSESGMGALREALPERSLAPDQKPLDKEMPVAHEVYGQAMESLKQVLSDIRLGRNVVCRDVKTAVTGMMESIMRNPDALLLFSNLKSRQQDTARHSINVSILSLVFGRHLGLDMEELVGLGIAALLHDIGEIRVPQEILRKPESRLTSDERQTKERHAEHGAQILRQSSGIPATAVDVALSHHERVDAKGYPRGLKEDEISFGARLVAIVDVYESVTNNPNAVRQISSTDALKAIYAMRNSFFDGELIENFIKCLGIYPIGSVVELSNGEVGIVISVRPEKHLAPTVMIVRNGEKQACHPPHVMNLDQFRQTNGKLSYSIRRVLEPDAYGIDLSDYLVRPLRF